MASGNRPVLVRIAGDTTLFKKSIKGVKGSLKGLGDAAKIGGAAIAAGFAAGAAGIVKIGGTFEGVEKTLRVGTGATGKDLQSLTDITKKIATAVPSDFGTVATAVADINTRLGLTGTELQSFSQQMLNLSNITGTDVEGNIASATRALGDWGDQAGTAGGAANYMFSIAQATGIEFGNLADQLVNYGAPLRQVGFTFEESAALIGKFEKEGVNAELVLGSLRQALGKMAREGEPAIETFKRTTEEIKNAGTASEANSIALELFGARAGPDMAAAIREGRFELEDFYKIMDGGGDDINTAAAETMTLSEKLTMLKNKVIVTLAPMVSKAFAAIERAFERVKPIVEDLTRKFVEFTRSDRFKQIKAVVTDAIEAIIKIIKKVIDKVREFIRENPEAAFAGLAVVIGTVLVGAIAAVVIAFATILSPALLVVGAIAGIAAGVVYAYERFEIFRDIVHGVADFFTDIVWPQIRDVVDNLVDAFQGFWDAIQGVFNLIKSLFQGDMAGVWDGFKQMVGGVVSGIVQLFIDLPMDIMRAAAPLVGKFALIVADFAVFLVDKVLDLVKAMPDKIIELLGNVASDMINLGKKIGGWIIDGIKALISSIDMGDIFGGLLDFGKGIFDKITPWSGKSRATRYGAGGVSPENWGAMGGIASQLDLSRDSMDWFRNPETIMHFQSKGLMDVFNALQAAGNVRGLEHAVHMGQGTGGFQKMTNDEIRVNINIAGSLVGSMPEAVIEEVRVGLIEAQNSGKELVVQQASGF